jgi:hypothetical protein
LAGKQVHVINYCCDKLTQAERDAAKQRVGEMLARNGAKQVAAPLRTVCTYVVCFGYCPLFALHGLHGVATWLVLLPLAGAAQQGG